MRFVGHAFVDWDDTIAENIKYFDETEEACARLIGQVTGADPHQVRERGAELDISTARQLGLVRDSLSIAWLACYREFCLARAVAPLPHIEAAIRQRCNHPYEVRQALLPGAADTLSWLYHTGFEITIWTAGDFGVQSRKITESGLEHLLHGKVVVINKTPQRLQEALHGRAYQSCFVVGNSIHSDINPALSVGLAAFHVPTQTWGYDHAHVDVTDPNYICIEQIADLPRALADRFRLAV